MAAGKEAAAVVALEAETAAASLEAAAKGRAEDMLYV
jgi:hypothetical protein